LPTPIQKTACGMIRRRQWIFLRFGLGNQKLGADESQQRSLKASPLFSFLLFEAGNTNKIEMAKIKKMMDDPQFVEGHAATRALFERFPKDEEAFMKMKPEQEN
jgi:hypothetical protein